MKAFNDIVTFGSGIHPNFVASDSSTPSTPDGTEYIAEIINQGWCGPQQDWMDYASLTPTGVIDSTGTSQIREAIQKGNGIGPGKYVQWGLASDPSVTGDRVLLLSEQGVLIAAYADLDAACYVGDANNATVAAAGGKFYRSSDAAGTTPDIAGPYIQLPAQPHPTYLKQYIGALSGGDFTVSGGGITTIPRCVAIPYKTLNGIWRLIYNFEGSRGTATNNIDVTFSGVTFKTGTDQAVSCTQSNTAVGSIDGFAASGTGTINHDLQIGGTKANSSGDVELDSKPPWADDFEFFWGITY
jgi:hypothetical protein